MQAGLNFKEKLKRREVKKMWKKCIVLLLVLSFCIAGCQNQSGDEATAVGYQVVDSQGTVIKLAQKPKRIMTTHFNLDNILMGVVNQDRVVALSKTMDDAAVSYIDP